MALGVGKHSGKGSKGSKAKLPVKKSGRKLAKAK